MKFLSKLYLYNEITSDISTEEFCILEMTLLFPPFKEFKSPLDSTCESV